MSVSSGFFNSVEGDRTYDAIQFSSIFDGMINDGVFEDFGDAFAVTPGVGLSVIIGTGRCWFNHTWTYNSTPITMALDSSSPDGSRWDAIALKIDHSEDVRENSIVKVNGAPSANPTKPSFTPTSTVFYYPIAYIKVNQSASSISTDNIEMVVGTDACPYATIVSSGVNFDVLGIEKGGTGNTYGIVDGGRKAGTTVGTRSTAEGNQTTASASYAHAEGNQTIASGSNSHAEGDRTTASSSDSHAEGFYTTASGSQSHAEGYETTASYSFAHAEGKETTSSGNASHAEGIETVASGSRSHAEGYGCVASGSSSHAAGSFTIASKNDQTVVGKYNVEDVNANFVVGSGSSDTSRKNCFRAEAGDTYGKTYHDSGADYAEMFEWQDGNPNKEDRVGMFVTLEGTKIRIANGNDSYILGIITGNASVIGDDGDEWHGMFVRDIYGRCHVIDVYIPEIRDKDGEVIEPAHYEKDFEISPDYDPSQEYIHRKDRPEWASVGLMGKLVVNDDGTSEVNGYVCPTANGIATKSNVSTRFRVMERLDATHIKVMII